MKITDQNLQAQLTELQAQLANARIAELEAENAELQETIDDYRHDISVVLDDRCPSDERHCGCVAILRHEFSNYQKAMKLIITMTDVSSVIKIAKKTLNETGTITWNCESVGEYWANQVDILTDKLGTLQFELNKLESENSKLKEAARWHPASEPPEEGQEIWAREANNPIIGRFIFTKKLFSIFMRHYTHWQPVRIPAPPEVA